MAIIIVCLFILIVLINVLFKYFRNDKVVGGAEDIISYFLTMVHAAKLPLAQGPTIFNDIYSEEEYKVIQEALKTNLDIEEVPNLDELPEVKLYQDLHRFKLSACFPARAALISAVRFISSLEKAKKVIIFTPYSYLPNLSQLFPAIEFTQITDINDIQSADVFIADVKLDIKSITAKHIKILIDLNDYSGKLPAGEIVYQPWAPHEYDLVELITTADAKYQDYDFDKLKRQYAYFKLAIREHATFHHEISFPGVDYCFDCAYEIGTWKQYLNSQDQKPATKANITHQIKEANKLGNLLCSPHGMLIKEPAKQRKQLLRQTEYDKYIASIVLRQGKIDELTKETFEKMLISEGFNEKEMEAINKELEDSLLYTRWSELPDELSYHKPSKSRYLYRQHFGQRKLLMSEIWFLTEHGHKSNYVVYAGAAPGIHIPTVARLFPNHHFELWDPAPFGIKENRQIAIYNDYFTDKSAARYARKSVLFISDIRSGTDDMGYEDFEKEVTINNQWQIDWINIMQPVLSMLKFRLPFTNKEYNYLAGDIYLQTWAPVDSAETRLVTDGKKTVKYSLTEYENCMFYYNNVVREFAYSLDYIFDDFNNDQLFYESGLCGCQDCRLEFYIWSLYFTKIAKVKEEEVKMRAMQQVIETNKYQSLHTEPHARYAKLNMILKRPFLRNDF